jgi:hypothetical protein
MRWRPSDEPRSAGWPDSSVNRVQETSAARESWMASIGRVRGEMT